MKRMLIVLAVAAGLSLNAGVLTADPGGYTPPGGQGAGGFPTLSQIGGPNTLLGAGDLPPGRGPDMYGFHPSIKKFFHIPPYGRCGPNGCAPGYGAMPPGYGMMPPGYGMGGPAYGGPNGQMMQGTLVFPHSPFVRSPRDFFMVDVNK